MVWITHAEWVFGMCEAIWDATEMRRDNINRIPTDHTERSVLVSSLGGVAWRMLNVGYRVVS